MSLETPKLFLGIPIPGSVFGYPGAGDACVGPWSIGSDFADNVYAAVEHYTTNWTLGTYCADRYGIGRSLMIIGMDATWGADAAATMTSPPSLLGYCPQGCDVFTVVACTYNCLFSINHVLTWRLEQFKITGVSNGYTNLSTLDYAAPGATGFETNIEGASVTWASDTAYCKLSLKIAGSNSGGDKVIIDRVKLGFLPGATALSHAELADTYTVPVRHSHTRDAQWLRGPGQFSHHVARDMGWRRSAMSLGFRLSSCSVRNQLKFFWNAQHGTPTKNDNIYNIAGAPGQKAFKRGVGYPILVCTGRYGSGKQIGVFDAQMVGINAPLDIDNSLEHVPETAVYTGEAVFEEIFF